MPCLAFELLLGTLLFLPYPLLVFPAAAKILAQMSRDNQSSGSIGFLVYSWKIGDLHPELAEASLYFFGGFIYFIALLIAWICYTGWLGI